MGQRNNLYANSLEIIIPAAYGGQVDALFFQNGIQQWGKYNIENNKVELHDGPMNGDQDLIEYASLLTLSRGGKVFSVPSEEVPDNRSIAAVLRF